MYKFQAAKERLVRSSMNTVIFKGPGYLEDILEEIIGDLLRSFLPTTAKKAKFTQDGSVLIDAKCLREGIKSKSLDWHFPYRGAEDLKWLNIRVT